MRPVVGFGVGSVRTERTAAKNSTGGRAAMAGDPHNEFFLMGVQLGLVGIALFRSGFWLLSSGSAGGWNGWSERTATCSPSCWAASLIRCCSISPKATSIS